MTIRYWFLYGLVMSIVAGLLFAPFGGFIVVPLFIILSLALGLLESKASSTLKKIH